MGNYGIKISRQGYPVVTCADHQLLFSSSFDTLMVLASGDDFVSAGSQYTFCTHGLSYTPAFFAIVREDGDDIVHFDYRPIRITPTKLFWDGTQDFGENAYISWFIFNRSITQSYTAPNIDITAVGQGSYNPNYGFKISKSGSDVKTAGLADLISFSGSSLANQPIRHQIIQKTGSGSITGGNTVQIAHGLDYKPMFIVYPQWPGTNPAEYYIDAVTYSVEAGPPVTITELFRTYCDNTNLNIYSQPTINYAYLILKDPLY